MQTKSFKQRRVPLIWNLYNNYTGQNVSIVANRGDAKMHVHLKLYLQNFYTNTY